MSYYSQLGPASPPPPTSPRWQTEHICVIKSLRLTLLYLCAMWVKAAPRGKSPSRLGLSSSSRHMVAMRFGFLFLAPTSAAAAAAAASFGEHFATTKRNWNCECGNQTVQMTLRCRFSSRFLSILFLYTGIVSAAHSCHACFKRRLLIATSQKCGQKQLCVGKASEKGN